MYFMTGATLVDNGAHYIMFIVIMFVIGLSIAQFFRLLTVIVSA